MTGMADFDRVSLERALATAWAHVARDAARLEDFPHRTNCDTWETTGNTGWVEGFWAGLLWLRVAHHDGPSHGAAATRWAEQLLPRAADETHDLGMLFWPGAVLGYRLTGDDRWREAALAAAGNLRDRLRPGGFIQAFGGPDSPLRQLVIIDTLTCLRLLIWASAESGDDRYLAAARTHATNTRRGLVRDDGRAYHVVVVDPETGQVFGPQGGQGLTPQSSWSRGQGWAILGWTALARATSDADLLAAARLVADCWLDLMRDHDVPPWDFDAPTYLPPPHLPPVPRDTSAGAIAAVGLLDLADLMGEGGAIYRAHALGLLAALSADYLNPPETPGMLREGCSNLPQGEARQALIYGDYFFVEALTRVLRPDLAARLLI